MYHHHHTAALLCTATESLRLATQLMEAVVDGPWDDEWDTQNHLKWSRWACLLCVEVLQERCGDAFPSVPDRVFDSIRNHVNASHWNLPGTEAIMLALQLANVSLDKATDILNEDGVLLGILDTIDMKLMCLSSVICRLGDDDERQRLLEAYIAGKPLPADPDSDILWNWPSGRDLPEWLTDEQRSMVTIVTGDMRKEVGQ